MKKYLIILGVAIIIAVPGYWLYFTSNSPSQDAYWYDEVSQMFRKCPKGMFNKKNQGIMWYSEEDTDRLTLEKTYKDFMTMLQQMAAMEQYMKEGQQGP